MHTSLISSHGFAQRTHSMLCRSLSYYKGSPCVCPKICLGFRRLPSPCRVVEATNYKDVEHHNTSKEIRLHQSKYTFLFGPHHCSRIQPSWSSSHTPLSKCRVALWVSQSESKLNVPGLIQGQEPTTISHQPSICTTLNRTSTTYICCV